MSKGFQCKQFFVAQDKCAMKVGTDSLILGSWAQPQKARHILDIGTGTGILALMLMQKAELDAHCVAVELDDDAASQASDNFQASPWQQRMSVLKQDITRYQPANRHDLIICNPPYYTGAERQTNAYKHASSTRLQARHDDGLTPESLFNAVAGLLTPEGRFYCVYPADRVGDVVNAASRHALFMSQRLEISAVTGKSPYLHAYCFQRQSANPHFAQLTIRNEQNQYSAEYRLLCKQYYLNF